MGLGQQYQRTYGLDDEAVSAARRRAQLATGLSLIGSSGRGISAIPDALLGGLGVYDDAARREYEVKRQRDQDEESRSYREALEERSRALTKQSEATAEATAAKTEDAAGRARQLREVLKDSPYSTEAAFADLNRLESLADKYYAEQAATRKGASAENIRTVSGYGETQFVDPISGKVLSKFPHPEMGEAGEGDSDADDIMASGERTLRKQVLDDISREVTLARRRHFERVGPDLDAPTLPAVPYPDDLERKATEKALSRYSPSEIPESLRSSFASEGIMAASPDRRRAEQVTDILMGLTTAGRSDLAKAVEANGMQDLLDALAAGYTVDQIIADLLRAAARGQSQERRAVGNEQAARLGLE